MLLLALGVSSVVACGNTEGTEGGAGTEDSLTTQPTSTTEVVRATTSTTSAAQAVAGGVCPALPPLAEPDPDRPTYVADAVVDVEAGTVTGTLRVTFTPDLDVDELVFRLWPNGGQAADGGVSLDVGTVEEVGRGALETSQPDPTTLEVAIPGGLVAGEPIEVEVPYVLSVPGAVGDRLSRSQDSMRLGTFLPLLAWEPGVGWAREPATDLFAEAVTSPTADYEVSITVPDGYDVLATGTPDGAGTWRGEAVRDFGASIGHFDTATAEVALPEPVTVTVGVHEGVQADPQEYLDKVVAALEHMALHFGAYPWETYSLALTPDLSGGIELPTFAMQGADTLSRTTSHEVAHQWFYGLVGNDQGRDPVLDEGLATYAEGRFEDTLALMQSRSIPADAVGRLDEPMTYWDERQASYYRGIYVQGAQAVASLGEVSFVDCALRHLVAANRFGVATPADLIAAAEVVWPSAAERLAAFGLVP